MIRRLAPEQNLQNKSLGGEGFFAFEKLHNDIQVLKSSNMMATQPDFVFATTFIYFIGFALTS